MSAGSSAALRQRLYETVLLLASEEGRVEERLAQAWRQHIRSLPADLFPPELRPQYETLRAELAALYPDPIATDGIDRNRAIDLAQRLILIYDATLR